MSGVDKTVLRINDPIMAIDPTKDPAVNPKLHLGMNPVLITMRNELHHIQTLSVAKRRRGLRALLLEDFLQEDAELRHVGLAYTNDVP